MELIYIIIGIAILIFIFKGQKKKNIDSEINSGIINNNNGFETEFPDRSDPISFFGKKIVELIDNGDLETANLNFAKLVESLRQQNINDKSNSSKKDLEEAKTLYTDFRIKYSLEYPEQFLQPEKRKGKTTSRTKHINKVRVINDQKKLKQLIKEISLESHPEFPLLRKEYATSSGMPFRDFSGWIIEQLKQKDFDSIFSFILTFYDATEPYEVDNIKKQFEKFLTKDFQSLFKEIDEQALYEIQAFFILQAGIDDGNREFWIGEDSEAKLLCKILSVYSFTVNPEKFKPLVNRANKFLREMRKDVDYWKGYKNYKLAEIPEIIKLELETDFGDRLKNLKPGERLHFFDFATIYSNRKFWNGDSSYKTRQFGINEDESISSISKIEIFSKVKDINSILEITSKGELKEAAEGAGFDIKKSWTLAKIFGNLVKTEEGKHFLSHFLDGKIVFSFKDEFQVDLKIILDNQEKIKRTIDLIAMI